MQSTNLFVAAGRWYAWGGVCSFVVGKLQVSPLRQTIKPFGFGREDRFLVDYRSGIRLRAAKSDGFATPMVAVTM